MDRLWAPWRMAYIDGLKQPGGCFLCEAAASRDDAANLVLSRGATCLCVLNRYPYNNGHVLVAPIAHKADLTELTADEMLELMQTTARLQQALRQLMSPHGFNLGINLGHAAGAGLPGHLHLHIVPRWQGDTNFMPAVGEVKVIPESLEAVYAKLSQALRDGGE